MENSNSAANRAVFHSQTNRQSLGPIDTCNSDSKVSVLNAKTTDEGCDPYRLVILMLITFIFACTKRQVRTGTHGDL